MRLLACLVACVLLGSPHTSLGEYIEITLPVEYETYRPCAPTEVRWESDIDPSEGDVLEISWHLYWVPTWNSVGLSSNDGVQPWPDPPCWDDGISPDIYELKIQYTNDPSVYDIVEFSTYMWISEEAYTIFIDFTGDATSYYGSQSRIDPAPYSSFSAYVGIQVNDHPGAPAGFTEVSFALDIEPEGVVVPGAFECLIPGGAVVGSWDDGVTLYADECAGWPAYVTYVARLDLFYVGGICDVTVVDHPDYPKRVLDCEEPGGVYEYAVGSHGGVGKNPVSTPVEPMSWGAIKAMYR